jgi:cytidine deaminase
MPEWRPGATPQIRGEEAMTDLDELLAKAREAKLSAYAPYSRFPVGVALRAASGRVYVGCNVENAAFPSGTCAEAGAIASMIVAGDTRIIDLVVVGNGDVVTPCGACRQRIFEFSDVRTRIHCAGTNGIQHSHRIRDLLPHAFGPHDVLKGPPPDEV